MTRLGNNSWGKSAVRVSKVHRGEDLDSFSDLTVQLLLQGEVEAAYRDGDNAGVVPTDTMRNTIYVLAQDHLGPDLEDFGRVLADHFMAKDGIISARVQLEEARWRRAGPTGFLGGGSERRTARHHADAEGRTVWGGIDGLVVLKTTDSAFSGFPRDATTILPEKDDRLLATTIAAEWRYEPVPADTTGAWETARQTILDHFFGDWSASVQHQGWLMGEAVLEAVPEMVELSFRLPNQHHLGFDLDRFGVEDRGIVFHPVSEPYGDIRFTVTR
ncbi:MAG TPA: urate oxidase [Acidimicrobiia bacterium]|nr:urate oxidase [Acidimicrobiia bacterium]